MKRARNPQFWIAFWSATFGLLLLAYFVDNTFSPPHHSLITLRAHPHGAAARNKPEPPALTETASLSPSLPATSTRVSTSPAAAPAAPANSATTSSSTTALIAPAATAGPSPAATPTEDLRDSARRAEAVDQIGELADTLFADQANVDGEWTTNQQGLNQQDYQLDDGTYVTSWLAQGDQGAGPVRAQEAQLPNGEVVDRWFNDDGTVSQIMHQYDRGHSVTVYYYDNGEVEAMRVVNGGHEIFSRYERGGRLIEKTVN